MVLVSVVVATDVVPGLRWDRLEIWENSASHDVWTLLSEYVEFRSDRAGYGPGGGPGVMTGITGVKVGPGVNLGRSPGYLNNLYYGPG